MGAAMRKQVRWAIRLFLVVPGICLAVGCTYRKDERILYREVPHAKWQKGDVLDYEILIPDYTRSYSLEVLIRHDNRYEYRDLALAYEISVRGHVILADSMGLTLADQPQRWNGKGVAKQQNRFLLPISARFPYSGLYKIKLRHIMRVPTLSGITEVGIRLTEGRDNPPATILPDQE